MNDAFVNKKHYLISYVWWRDGHDFHFENDVIDKSPAEWILSMQSQPENHSLLNVIEITKEEFEMLDGELE